MILQRLVEFWESRDTGLPSGYQVIVVSKVIRLTANGTLRDVLSPSGDKVGTREGMKLKVPHISRTGSALRPRLFADDAGYTFGLGDQVAKHAAYMKALTACAEEAGSRGARIIRGWLDKGADSIDGITPEDVVTFEVDGISPCDDPTIRSWWPSYVAKLTAKPGPSTTYGGGNLHRCLVTGREDRLARRMPVKIKGVPKSSPAAPAELSLAPSEMVSGYSYGLVEAYNSPIGEGTAESIANGLNYLLASERHRLKIGKAAYVYWTRTEQEFDFFKLLNQPQTEQVAAILKTPFTGKPIEGGESNFFVLSLSANGPRMVIRDYHETTLPNVKAALAKWFRRIALDTGSPDSRPVGLDHLAASLYRDREDARKHMPAHIPTALLASAMRGTPIPTYLLGQAVKRNLAMQGPFYEYMVGRETRRSISLPRLALIKAILNHPLEEDIMETQIDPKDRQAFNCGRLLAVLDGIYVHFVNADKAKGAKWSRPRSTVSARYYGSASSSPASVFGTLIQGSRPHLTKLRGQDKDFGYELKLEEIATAIGAEFPRTLDVRRQGVFALGYYHQVASDRAARAKRGIQLDDTDEAIEGESV